VRRILSYVAVIWGAVDIVVDVKVLTGHTGVSHPGIGTSVALSVVLIRLGMKEITTHHARRFRSLPWFLGVKAVAVGVILFLIFATHIPYPANVQATFVNGCEARGGSAGYCGCVLSWFESHESLASFAALNDQARVTGQVPPEITAAVDSSCGRG
jgi:hypothetical protein